MIVSEASDDGYGQMVRRVVDEDRAQNASRHVLNMHSYLASFGAYPVLRTPKDWHRAYDAFQRATSPEQRRKAEDAIVYGARHLVRWIARSYQGFGLSMIDLLQEGMMGVRQAVPSYDPRHAAKLMREAKKTGKGAYIRQAEMATYVTYSARRAIAKALTSGYEGSPYRIPLWIHLRRRLVDRVCVTFLLLHDQEPTKAQILQVLHGMARPKYARAMTPRLLTRVMDETVAYELTRSCSADDLDPLNIEDPTQRDAASTVEVKQLWSKVRRFIRRLPESEREVIRHQLGLQHGPNKSLSEIARERGVTRQRIHQVRQAGLKRLLRVMKSPHTLKHLLSLLDGGKTKPKNVARVSAAPEPACVYVRGSDLMVDQCVDAMNHFYRKRSPRKALPSSPLIDQIWEEMSSRVLPSEPKRIIKFPLKHLKDAHGLSKRAAKRVLEQLQGRFPDRLTYEGRMLIVSVAA